MPDSRTQLYTCRYCGAPSHVAPKDQSAPADYCHESDHSTGEQGEIEIGSPLLVGREIPQ